MGVKFTPASSDPSPFLEGFAKVFFAAPDLRITPLPPPVKTEPLIRDPRVVLVEHSDATYSLHRVVDGTVIYCVKEAEFIKAPSAWRLF